MMRDLNYNNILIKYISNLSKYKSISGGEGVAYFVSDDFVVKKYYNDFYLDEFIFLFDDFCREMQEISSITNFPKIYAWIKVPDDDCYLDAGKDKFTYYILEERVKGRNLYQGFLFDSYDYFKQECSKQYFSDILNEPLDNVGFFNKIIKRYIEDFIYINKFLESMPEKDILKFINDLYVADKNTRLLKSDVQPSNIMFDFQKLRPIDPLLFSKKIGLTEQKLKNDLIYGIISVFWTNELCLNQSFKKIYDFDDDIIGNKFQKLQNENMKISKAVVIKFLKVFNKYFGGINLTDDAYLSEIDDMLMFMFNGSKKDVYDVEKTMNLL